MISPRAPYWTADEDRQLRILWRADWSVNSIASRLPGRSRNGVTGRVFRLGLDPRPSPIPCELVSLVRRRELALGGEAARDAIARAA